MTLEIEQKARQTSTFIDNMRLPIHRWLRFSAGFSAQWVRSVIDEVKKANPHVVLLDPFAGVGTAILAAEESGVEAYGLESQPFIARIAAAKMLWASNVEDFARFANSVLQDASAYGQHIPKFPKLVQSCYPPPILRELNALKTAWMNAQDGSSAAELTWLALTAVLRICSPVGTAPWQYVLPKKSKKSVINPNIAFATQVQKMVDDMRSRQSMGIEPKGKIIYGDARDCQGIKSNSVNLVVTSPPYTNNYDYADATRLEMTFWGDVESWGDLQDVARNRLIRSCSQHVSIEHLELDPTISILRNTPIFDEIDHVCRQLNAERSQHGGHKAYHIMVAAYFADMLQVWQSLRRVCQDGSLLCFVVGDSAPYGIYVPVDRWLGELAVFAGFESYRFEKIRDRNIKWRNRKHRVPLHEGKLWVQGGLDMPKIAKTAKTASPGHKLGQMIGNLFEALFTDDLASLCKKHGFYLDRKGPRPAVRGKRIKLTWKDKLGNKHDLDYVIEKGGSSEKQGSPIAFIEIAWRRYTKHSRNKTGEFEGSLLPLRDSYITCRFLGTIVAGEYTAGGKNQLTSHGIEVLHVSFENLADSFEKVGVDLSYPESASKEQKASIVDKWQSLPQAEIEKAQNHLKKAIGKEYTQFRDGLEKALLREIELVVILPLFGEQLIYKSVALAIEGLGSFDEHKKDASKFAKYEVMLRYQGGDQIGGTFHTKADALKYLKMFL